MKLRSQLRLLPPLTALVGASLTLSCGSGPVGRQTTANNALGDNPWLVGARCGWTRPPIRHRTSRCLPRETASRSSRGRPFASTTSRASTDGTVVHDSHEHGMPSGNHPRKHEDDPRVPARSARNATWRAAPRPRAVEPRLRRRRASPGGPAACRHFLPHQSLPSRERRTRNGSPPVNAGGGGRRR